MYRFPLVLRYWAGRQLQPSAKAQFLFDLNGLNENVWFAIPSAARGGELGYTDVSIDKKNCLTWNETKKAAQIDILAIV